MMSKTKEYIFTELINTLKKLKCNIISTRTITEIHFEFKGKKFTLLLKEYRK